MVVYVVELVSDVIVQVVIRVAAPHDGAAESPEKSTNKEVSEATSPGYEVVERQSRGKVSWLRCVN
jgi:hypothetical protein